MNEVIKTINQRTSLRRFSNKPVSKEHQELIINSALRAPTAGNLMFYSIIKVENKSTLETLSHTCDDQPFIKSASFALIFVVDYQKLYDYFAYNNYFNYCEEQHKVPEFPELSDLMLGSQDAMCAAQNSVIASESLGVGSCYIGDIIENYEIHQELFQFEKLTFPLGMLVFGNYPEGYKPKIQSRFDTKYVVFDEKYKRLNKDELTDMFREREKSFRSNNKLQAKNNAQFLYARKVGSDFSVEMRRSVQKAYNAWLLYGKEQIKIFNNEKHSLKS